MASIYTPDGSKVSLDTLRNLITYLLARITHDPHGAAFVAPITALRNDWTPVAAKEQQLDEAITLAQAGVTAADRGLDGASGLVKNAIHKGKKPDLTLPLHRLFFGTSTPSGFETPTLAAQLAAMETWPGLLATAKEPELVALVATVLAAVNTGKAAEKALAGALAARDAFRLGGERKKIFDKFNSVCATTHGALKALVHDHPELGLVSGYAESFFQRGPGVRAKTAMTLDEANVEVESLQEQLAAATAERDDLKAREAAHADQMKIATAAREAAEIARKNAHEADLAAKAALEAASKLDPAHAGKAKGKKK